MTGGRYRRYSHGPAARYEWWVSPWDRRAHAYQQVGDVTAAAICGHSAVTANLIVDDGAASECLGCVVAIAKSVVGPANDRFGWRVTREPWREGR